jgi:hypothetical protein
MEYKSKWLPDFGLVKMNNRLEIFCGFEKSTIPPKSGHFFEKHKVGIRNNPINNAKRKFLISS